MRQPNPAILAQMGLLLAASLLAVGCGGSSTTAAQAPADKCTALQGKIIPASVIGVPYTDGTKGAVVTSATLVAATNVTNGVEYCKVLGTITPLTESEVVQDLVTGAYTVVTTPDITFGVNLPTTWNSKTVHYGGGGFDGSIPNGEAGTSLSGVKSGIQRGYVTIGDDSGHLQSQMPTAVRNSESAKNFGRQSIKKTHDVALYLTNAYYGSAPKYNYFQGFSQGGHEAVLAARFYPYDFDGVIAGSPAYNLEAMHYGAIDFGKTLYAGRTGGATPGTTKDTFGWSYPATGGEGWISRPLAKLIAKTMLLGCGATADANGTTNTTSAADGIVYDPGTTTCVAARTKLLAHDGTNTLRCATTTTVGGVSVAIHSAAPGAGGDNDTCLSDAQIETLAHLSSRYNFGAQGLTLEGGLKNYAKWPYMDGMWMGEDDSKDATNTHDIGNQGFGSAWNAFDAFQASFPTQDQLGMMTRHSWTAADAHVGGAANQLISRYNSGFDITAKDVNGDPWVKRIEEVSTWVDTNSVDFGEFQGRGGKFIHYVGSTDVSIAAYNSVDLYFRMTGQFLTKTAAASGSTAATYNDYLTNAEVDANAGATQRSGAVVSSHIWDNFYTFYMIPGYGHNLGYFKADVDWLTALENWRENATAPGTLRATDINAVATTGSAIGSSHASLGTRPVCQFPYTPKYTSGSNQLDTNYTCVLLTAYPNTK